MALYDNQNRRARRTAAPTSVALAAAHPGQLVGLVRLIGLAVLLIGWVAGAYAGIVYWSFQGSLLGVIGSTAMWGAAAAATWSAFAALEEARAGDVGSPPEMADA